MSATVKPCKYCGETTHYPFQCRLNPKPRKRIKQKGKNTLKYEKWRDTVAKPYLDSLGHRCVLCGNTQHLDVDHIKTRGSRADLKMVLTNVQYLCRDCHRMKTDGKC